MLGLSNLSGLQINERKEKDTLFYIFFLITKVKWRSLIDFVFYYYYFILLRPSEIDERQGNINYK